MGSHALFICSFKIELINYKYMCGILGSVNLSFDDSVLDLIRHRGPDDSGINVIKTHFHRIMLAHRRLSILDLSPAGHQPMFTECGNYALIFNGEIYNHLELRTELTRKINFKGHSDTETILYYLKEFGINSIKKFNGIFSIAFLNKVTNKLFLARDHYGVKPLYYYIGENNDIVFSSEIRPIKFLLPEYNLDNDALANLLRLRYNPSPDTLYQQIKKIRAGHFLEVDLNDKKLLLQHHSFVSKIPETTYYNANEVINLYGQKLEKAVKRQLLSDVEVGIFLSGGIDSAIVAALAQKHYTGKLKTFTIGFEGDHYENEIEDAAETAHLLGLEHRYRKITFPDFIDIIKKCTLIVEEPLATTSIIPMYFLSELASKEVKVVLTGQGADEPLGGYTRYKSELLRYMVPALMRNKILPLIQFTKIQNEKVLRGVKSIGVENEIDRFLTTYEVFTKMEINKLISCNDYTSYQKIEYFSELLNSETQKHPVERMMALDTRLNLADDLLNYTDKVTMNFALECRVPMLDHELVNFIESVPYKLKLNLFGGKIIHKQYGRKILPDKIIRRKKKGFLSPTKIWFKNDVDIIKDILLKSGTIFSDVFNQTYVAKIIEQHLSGYNREKQIYLLLSIYFWLEALNDGNKIGVSLHSTSSF
jgi:asparagine synthase (glutamine-hydrolysing)